MQRTPVDIALRDLDVRELGHATTLASRVPGTGLNRGGRRKMRVNEAMTPEVCVCTPTDTIRDCARAMAKIDTGVLPVADGSTLIGMITDRDIAIRAIAAGKGPDTPVREVLTREVLFCYEDQELDQVARAMGMAKVRRVPVLARDNSLIGMLSLGDVARREAAIAVRAVAQLSEPGGTHSQSP